MGPFQYLHVTLLALPILGMANHNLLQIFTATTPPHHCRPPPNASSGPWVLPTGPNGKPEKCLRFVHLPNGSLSNETQRATEPCLDGWVYNSTRDTFVMEVCLLPSPPPLPQVPHISYTTRGQERRRGPCFPGIQGQGAGQAKRKDPSTDALDSSTLRVQEFLQQTTIERTIPAPVGSLA
jgi:hypothetical protein